jgi:hypothetical protein
MKLNGQFHILAALPAGKEPPVDIGSPKVRIYFSYLRDLGFDYRPGGWLLSFIMVSPVPPGKCRVFIILKYATTAFFHIVYISTLTTQLRNEVIKQRQIMRNSALS